MTADPNAPLDEYDLPLAEPPRRSTSLLLIAWLLVIFLLAAVAIWLVLAGKETRARLAAQVPPFIAMLPADPNAPPPATVAAVTPKPPEVKPPEAKPAPVKPAEPAPAPAKAEAPKPPAPVVKPEPAPVVPAPVVIPSPPPAPAASPTTPPVHTPSPSPVTSSVSISPQSTPRPPVPVVPAPPVAAPAVLPAPVALPTVQPLAPVEASLLETTAAGALPIPSRDGERLPWRVYARPVEALPEGQVRVAVLVAGLGMRPGETQAAVKRLPPSVSLAFAALAERLPEQIAGARAGGHEVFLDLALEANANPPLDPDSHRLQAGLAERELRERLDWQLARATAYVGVLAGPDAARFSAAIGSNAALLPVLKKRGLMYVDSRANPRSVAPRMARDYGVPRAMVDVMVDHHPDRSEIDAALLAVETAALRNGQALALIGAGSAGLDRLDLWLATLPRKGIALVPVSAIANRQPDPEVTP